MNYRRNHDGYYDPTAGEALEHIVHEQRRKHRLAQKQEARSPKNRSHAACAM